MAIIVFFEPIQTYSNVLLYHVSTFQIIKTRGLPLLWSDELSTNVLCRNRNCQQWHIPNPQRIKKEVFSKVGF